MNVCFGMRAIINSGSVELFRKKKAASHKLASEFSSHKGSLLFPFCIISHGSPPTSTLHETALKMCTSCCGTAPCDPITLWAVDDWRGAQRHTFFSSFFLDVEYSSAVEPNRVCKAALRERKNKDLRMGIILDLEKHWFYSFVPPMLESVATLL